MGKMGEHRETLGKMHRNICKTHTVGQRSVLEMRIFSVSRSHCKSLAIELVVRHAGFDS